MRGVSARTEDTPARDEQQGLGHATGARATPASDWCSSRRCSLRCDRTRRARRRPRPPCRLPADRHPRHAASAARAGRLPDRGRLRVLRAYAPGASPTLRWKRSPRYSTHHAPRPWQRRALGRWIARGRTSEDAPGDRSDQAIAQHRATHEWRRPHSRPAPRGDASSWLWAAVVGGGAHAGPAGVVIAPVDPVTAPRSTSHSGSMSSGAQLTSLGHSK